MHRRIPGSMRTCHELSDLIEGRLSWADARGQLVELATRLIIEEALDAETRDTLGRDYYEHGGTSTLDSFGFDEETAAALAGARAKFSGGVIIAGATGDGKSTTLVRCLQTLYAEHEQKISIVTIEDPVEYRIRGDGIIQIPVKSAGDADARTAAFRQALMHFVRINPDVGAISEIRDADAAKEVLQFIDTGHQVWTTIHGSSANGILFRLIEMGLTPEELCKPGSIELLMKQSLAPEERGRWRRQLETLECDLGEVRLRNGEGCPGCRPDGGDTVARQGLDRLYPPVGGRRDHRTR